MAHVRVALYRFTPGSLDEIKQKVAAEMVPTLSGESGFQSYEVVQTGDDEAVSLSHWDSAADAERASETIREWVQSALAGMVETSEVHIGETVVSA
jgi:heme-degrading monooxygenase HmoA